MMSTGTPLGQESSLVARSPRQNCLPPDTQSRGAKARTQPVQTWVVGRHQHPSPFLLSPPPQIPGATAFPSHCSWGPREQNAHIYCANDAGSTARYQLPPLVR